MSLYSLIPKTIFDPEVYMLILNEISKGTHASSINLYTLVFLNSFYMNEFLDQDLVWSDETDESRNKKIDERIQTLIKVGIELVNISQQNEPLPPQPQSQQPQQSSVFADVSQSSPNIFEFIQSTSPDPADKDELSIKAKQFKDEQKIKQDKKNSVTFESNETEKFQYITNP